MKLPVRAAYWEKPSGDVKIGAAAGSHVTAPVNVLDAAPPTPERLTVPEKSNVIVIALARAGTAITRSTATTTSSFFMKPPTHTPQCTNKALIAL